MFGQLRDHYCLFLPLLEASVSWDHRLLRDVVRLSRKSAAGRDGWTVPEVKALPLQEWGSLLEVLKKGWEPLCSTLFLPTRGYPYRRDAT